MNTEEFTKKWEKLKKEVKKKWGKLTDVDISEISGKKDKLIEAIQNRYGATKEKAEKEFNEWVEKIKSTTDDEKK